MAQSSGMEEFLASVFTPFTVPLIKSQNRVSDAFGTQAALYKGKQLPT